MGRRKAPHRTSARTEGKAAAAERKPAEKGFQASHSLLRAVIEAIPDLIFVKDLQGRFVMGNPALARFYGTSVEDLIGKDDAELGPPDVARYLREVDLRIMNSGQTETFEEEVPSLGEPRTYFTTKAPYRDHEGNVIGLIGVARDITERKQAAEALRRTEARLKSIFESGITGVLFWDVDGNITQANDALLEMIGYTREDLHSGKLRWREITPPEYSDADDHALEEIKASGACTPFEKEYIRKDGTRIPVVLAAALFEGSTSEGACFVLDITERKRPERELRQLEARQAKELAAMAAVVNDMLRGEVDDKETEKRVLDTCLEATDSAYGQIGAVNEHGKYDTTTYSSRTLEDCAFPEALAWEVSTGMTIRGIWGWPMLHGETVVCNDLEAHPGRVGVPKGHVPLECFLGVPLKRNGKVVGMVAVANKPGGYTQRDTDTLVKLASIMSVSHQHRLALTAAKRSADELERLVAERTEALERSNKELEQFAYVSSHDLQEPLRMVASYAQLLSKRYKGKLDQSGDEFIEFMVDGATRMQHLIDALLDFSRIGTRGKDPAPTASDGVLDRTLSNLRAAIEESGAAVTSDPLPTVMADDVQLGRVFQNLVGNAIKFHGDESPRIHVSAQEKEGEWVFSVRDNGIGIDPDQFDRIFVIFQRLHARADFPGAGIGLAVSKKIVERHGGRIWVESEPQGGSAFYFTISSVGESRAAA